MNDVIQFPRQALPFSRKTKKWREQCLLWGDSRSSWNYSPVRKAKRDKRVNYDLVRGILHMEDVALILNPSGVDADYIPKKIQHFPLMNAKLNVLIGISFLQKWSEVVYRQEKQVIQCMTIGIKSERRTQLN